MKQFLLFDNELIAHRRNREMMGVTQKESNPGGDGKAYVTTERHALHVATDGQAILEVDDVSQLTDDEKRTLINIRPSKFDSPEGDLIFGQMGLMAE